MPSSWRRARLRSIAVVASGGQAGRVPCPVSIRDLLSSPDDLGLVSSLTLFVGVAHGLVEVEPSLAGFIERAWVLEVAAAHGPPRCESTTTYLAGR